MRPPKRNKRKSPPRKRNLAAKVLRDPLFRPKVMANPNAYRRRKLHRPAGRREVTTTDFQLIGLK